MLALRIAQEKAHEPFKLRGLPPKEAKNTRTLFQESPEEIDRRLGVKIRFDDSGTSPFSAAASAAQAVSIDRRVEELYRALILNGSNQATAREQANQMLRGVSEEVRQNVLAQQNGRSKTEKDLTRAEAATAIVSRLDDLIDKVSSSKVLLEAEGDTSDFSKSVEDFRTPMDKSGFYSNPTSQRKKPGLFDNLDLSGEYSLDEITPARGEKIDPAMGIAAEEYNAPFYKVIKERNWKSMFDKKDIPYDSDAAKVISRLYKEGKVNYDPKIGYTVPKEKNTSKYRYSITSQVFSPSK